MLWGSLNTVRFRYSDGSADNRKPDKFDAPPHVWHFGWRYVPTLNQSPEKQSRDAALRVHEKPDDYRASQRWQRIPAKWRGSAASSLQGTFGQPCPTVYARLSTLGELARRGFSPEGMILSKTSCVCRTLCMAAFQLAAGSAGSMPLRKVPWNVYAYSALKVYFRTQWSGRTMARTGLRMVHPPDGSDRISILPSRIFTTGLPTVWSPTPSPVIATVATG
jgi:hypothetical protein